MSTESLLLRWARDSLIIPVIVVDELAAAVPLAKALHEGGLTTLEVTLRTPVALDAISAIRAALPDTVVGAGTVINVDAAAAARKAGAQFAVSPGYLSALGRYCGDNAIPLLPGVSTASEVMAALADGYDFLKFFPAAAAGGTAMLEALRGPFPEVKFCPTGGVNASNAANYLALANVVCVGGSWMVSRELVRAADWGQITSLSRQALAALKDTG